MRELEPLVQASQELAPREQAPADRQNAAGGNDRMVRMAEDDWLVAAVRLGDERAFEAIHDRYSRGLHAFCRHMLVSTSEAEDAVQQTLLNAYQAISANDRAIDLKPWLYRIARNHCISLLRKRREHPSDAIEVSVPGLAEHVQHREDLRDLMAGLDRLPNEQREALLLSALGSLSHEEIAGILGCRREKVKSLVFRASSALNKQKAAREISCSDIRERLERLSGGSLRRVEIREHLHECDGCREFRANLRRERSQHAALPFGSGAGLPVKAAGGVAAATVGAGAAASGVASTPIWGGLLKLAAVAAIGAIGASGTIGGPLGNDRSRSVHPAASDAAGAAASSPAAVHSAGPGNPATTAGRHAGSARTALGASPGRGSAGTGSATPPTQSDPSDGSQGWGQGFVPRFGTAPPPPPGTDPTNTSDQGASAPESSPPVDSPSPQRSYQGGGGPGQGSAGKHAKKASSGTDGSSSGSVYDSQNGSKVHSYKKQDSGNGSGDQSPGHDAGAPGKAAKHTSN